MAKRETSVAVVGAGPGGLAAAMILASSGARVTVYEAQAEIGGRTCRVTLGEHGFDRGPTFFLMPYVLEEVFRAAGARLTDRVDLRRLDPMYRLVIGDPSDAPDAPPTVVDTTQDVLEMSRRLARIDPRDGAAFPRFIADNRAKLRLMEPILRSAITSPIDLINLQTSKFLPHLHPHLSVAGLLRRYFRTHEARLAVSFQSKYLGMSPMDCPSLFTILPFIEYEYGVWHPIGGCNAIMHAMADRCREMGVRIECSRPVRAVEFEGRRVRGLRFDDGERTHDHVMMNADAAWALKNLVPEPLRPRHTDAGLDARRYSCSTFMMYLGLDGEVDLPHHSIYISRKYRQNLADIGGAGDAGRLSEDPSVYVCNPAPLDPTLAPRGCSSLYVLMPCPNGKSSLDFTPGSATAARARELVLRQLRDRFGIEDVQRRTRVEQVYTPRDWAGLGINFGATFNMAHNLGQMLHRRVPHRYPGVDGLWFVGGATHPGSGLPVIFLSSQIASRLLCEQEGLACSLDRTAAADPGAARAGRVPVLT